jgi:hypothetical protein
LIITIITGSLWLSWIGRNFVELGAFVPFTTQGGNAYFPVYNDVYLRQSNLFSDGYWFDISIPADIEKLDEVERDRELKLLALNWIRDHPKRAFCLALLQPIHLWQPDTSGDISYLVLAIAGLIGLIWSLTFNYPSVILWVLLFSTVTLLTITSIGIPRFRVILDPLIMVLAAYAFVTSGRRIYYRFLGNTSSP